MNGDYAKCSECGMRCPVVAEELQARAEHMMDSAHDEEALAGWAGEGVTEERETSTNGG